MSENVLLSAETGRTGGTRASRRLRREGRVPAVVYGLDREPVAVSVEWPELRRAITTHAGLNALITLDIDGEQQLSVVKDIQRHPVRRDVVHVDFLRVTADQQIEVEVPVVMVGEALEVTRANGMVNQTLHELPIVAKPGDVPDAIEFDVSEMELGDTIRVEDLPLPAGVTPTIDADEAIATAEVTRSTLEAMAAEAASEEAEGEEEAGEAAEPDAADSDDGGD